MPLKIVKQFQGPSPGNPPDFSGKKLLAAIFLFTVVLLVSGCATAPHSRPTRVLAGVNLYDIDRIKYVAIKEFSKKKNLDLDWDIISKNLTIKGNDINVKLYIGSCLALVNNQPIFLDDTIKLYKGSIVAPYSFLVRVFGAMDKEKFLAKDLERDTAYRIKKIVVDAGHGGREPGARGITGLKEKEVVLDIARRLKKELDGKGINVILTRRSDQFVSLWKRSHIANTENADLFVSIHANASRAYSAHGFEVYYLSEATDDNARALAAAENASLEFEESVFRNVSTDLRATLWDIRYTENRAESIELAKYISKPMGELGVRARGVKGAGFYVLKYAKMPSVLVEVGFISNRSEEAKLKDKYYRQKLAKSIANGIFSYKKEFERTNGFTN